MVTKEQAISAGRWPNGGCSEFHYGECKRTIGPRGGETIKRETWRVNGQCKTWKRDPEAFKLPIKFGLYGHGYLTDRNASEFHSATECPLDHNDVPEGVEGQDRRNYTDIQDRGSYILED